MHLLAVGSWRSSWSMLLRDMLSKAPIPSTERMVWFGSGLGEGGECVDYGFSTCAG